MAFGYGDGGGGPTREMLENLRAMARFPGLPQARQRPAGDFFRDLEATSGADLPTWNGELYLEYHRGTYTTQSRNKRANRKAEFALHDAEFLASFASHLDPDYAYPSETFTQAWRLVCLNQFHDIIPGSSIGQVYVDSMQQYADVQQMTDTVRDQALASLAARVGGDWLLVNPTSFTRSDPVFLPGDFSCGLERDGQALLIQPVAGGNSRRRGRAAALLCDSALLRCPNKFGSPAYTADSRTCSGSFIHRSAGRPARRLSGE